MRILHAMLRIFQLQPSTLLLLVHLESVHVFEETCFVVPLLRRKIDVLFPGSAIVVGVTAKKGPKFTCMPNLEV